MAHSAIEDWWLVLLRSWSVCLVCAGTRDTIREEEAPMTKEKQAGGDEEGSDDDEAVPSILCSIQ